jgi:hypothetical protein
MAEIVLVHGIDQQQKSADVLESEWLPALAGIRLLECAARPFRRSPSTQLQAISHPNSNRVAAAAFATGKGAGTLCRSDVFS